MSSKRLFEYLGINSHFRLFFIFAVACSILSHVSLVALELNKLVAMDIKPWGMAELPNGDVLVSSHSGQLYRIDGKMLTVRTVSGVPKVLNKGQGGLMDVVVDPQFADQPWVYLSYSKAFSGGSNTAIYRAQLNDTALTKGADIYVAQPGLQTSHHFGSRMAFDEQGLLYFSIGDRGLRDQLPQDKASDGGKVYRINKDGSIPKHNPYASSEKPAVFSLGHRNPQGMLYHPVKKQIWVHEHGPKGGDEINAIHAAKNYAWPLLTYGVNYSGSAISHRQEAKGFESPLWHWTPSIAPSDMVYIHRQGSPPSLKGQLIVGSLKFSQLWRCTSDQPIRCAMLIKAPGRVRSLLSRRNGQIWVGIEGKGIYQLR